MFLCSIFNIIIAGIISIIQAFASRGTAFSLYSTYIEGIASIGNTKKKVKTPFRIPLSKVEAFSLTKTSEFVIKSNGMDYAISADKSDIEKLNKYFSANISCHNVPTATVNQ